MMEGGLVDNEAQELHRLGSMKLELNREERALWDAVYAAMMGRQGEAYRARGEAARAILTRRDVVGEAP